MQRGFIQSGAVQLRTESMGWKCHACGLSGDPVKWLEATEGLSFSDAVKRLASIAGVSVNCSGAGGADGSTCGGSACTCADKQTR